MQKARELLESNHPYSLSRLWQGQEGTRWVKMTSDYRIEIDLKIKNGADYKVILDRCPDCSYEFEKGGRK